MTGGAAAPGATYLTFHPVLRLTELVDRPGGLRREDAVAKAEARVERLREPSMDAIEELIRRLETVSACKNQDAGEQQKAIRQLATEIVSLGGTYGLGDLVEAAKRLCDLTVAFIARGQTQRDPIEVHVRAIRLLAPRSPVIPKEAARSMLLELRRVLRHYDAKILEGS